MELEDFVKKFAEQFEDSDPNEFSAQTAYQDLEEWSSMSALAIIAMVDEHYGKTVRAGDFEKAKTIQDLFNIINAR